MSDGTRLRQAWSDALGTAENNFRQLLTSYNSGEWKHVSLATDASPTPPKGKARVVQNPELTDVVVHRKSTKSGENVYRVVLEVPATDELAAPLDAWKAIITTPELRQEWDPAVEGAHLVEMFDHRTRISKTQFTLGWPANPRDAVTISRLHQDASTIIDVTTSLPRSPDEPAYVRPSPPYVRSHVELFAWCIQYVQPSTVIPSTPSESLRKRFSTLPRLRISCFCQHDLRALWNFGSTATVCQQLCTMMLGLYKIVKKRGSKVPMLDGYGFGVGVERVRFQLDRQALTVEYLVHLEEDGGEEGGGIQNLDELREHKRLARSIEFILPASESWDVQLTTKASLERVEKLPWTATAVRAKPPPPSPGNAAKLLELTVLRITHSSLPDAHSILKVRVVLELSGPSKSGIRLNGLPQTIQVVEERDPGSLLVVQQQLLQDASSVADASIQTSSSVSSVGTIGSGGGTPVRPLLAKDVGERSAAAEKSILSRVKRSYIYFSSLLQEPEAKWKRTTEARGVSVTQLDSIDPTLVVYRAEATFVGLGLWDLYGALVSPGARAFWDKQHEDAVLLEDVNELTELWHFKTKPAWPVFGRDNVLLKTVYKSPTTIHVFLFSADDPYLFPSLPPTDPSFIRAQVDLQGWAIEALSPSTTQLTLLEQSDPKGWSNKASTIPAQMVGAVAGVGEFVIKCGGPPVVTRLAGARSREMRYDHEKGVFRVAYEASEGRRGVVNGVNGVCRVMTGGTAGASASADAGSGASGEDAATLTSSGSAAPMTTTTTDVHTIECEIRCDLDTWASCLDIVVDPPPRSVTALRRHRLSSLGGGLWLTITHDALFSSDERLLAIVRRGPMVMNSSSAKGAVMVNGARVSVDVEEISEAEVRALAKRKRVRPVRVPLDQPPVVSAMRRRRAEWDADGAVAGQDENGNRENAGATETPEPTELKRSGTGSSYGYASGYGLANAASWLSAPKLSSPLANFWSSAVEQAASTTQSAVAAISLPAGGNGGSGTAAADADAPLASKLPMQHVVETLHWLRELQMRPEEEQGTGAGTGTSSSGGWTLVSSNDRDGLTVKRKLFPDLSSVVPVHKGEKVIEGVSAEEVSSIVSSYECRRAWDDRFGSAVVLEQFGARCQTAFVTTKGGFPFRDRGFLVASVVARARLPQSTNGSGSILDGEVGGVRTPSGDMVGSGSGSVLSSSQDARVVHFFVSASFHPDSTSSSFSAAKYNPSAYPLGRVFIDGWVFETLDPYTKENYTIPSTRVTRVVAVDHRGSIPVAVNSMMNAGMARAVGAVEVYLKGTSPLPVVRLPGAAVVLSEHVKDKDRVPPVGLDGLSATWKVRRRDEQRTLVESRYDPAERTYTGSIFLTTSTGGMTRSISATTGTIVEESNSKGNSKLVAATATAGVINSPPVEVSSPPPPLSAFNQRRTSTSTGSGSANQSPSNEQMRSSSSAFTVKGELKHTTDLIVAEVVVDTKLYPEGYDISISSTVREKTAKYISLASSSSSSDSDADTNADSDSSTDTTTTTSALPVSTSIYTVPASPLHSSGLNADRPPRHLLRLMLPTAQYQTSTILQDPLTGETRGASTKPQWYADLQEKGFVVEVRIQPTSSGGPSGSKNNVTNANAAKKSDDVTVRVDGVVVGVASEKESLTALGRDELQDDRVSRMLLLQRSTDDEGAFPGELEVPLGRAEHMLNDTAVVQADNASDESKAQEESSPQQEVTDKSPAQDSPENGGAAQSPAPIATSGGLLNFWNNYPNLFVRWTTTMTSRGGTQIRSPSFTSTSSRRSSGSIPRVPGGPDPSGETQGPKAGSTTTGTAASAGTTTTTTTTTLARSPKTYPLSVVLIVALIAFLVGSLLRSLLSPADFIYVVTDIKDAEEVSAGWREIRRLVEVKYIVGGWDFQIAVVRRH